MIIQPRGGGNRHRRRAHRRPDPRRERARRLSTPDVASLPAAACRPADGWGFRRARAGSGFGPGFALRTKAAAGPGLRGLRASGSVIIGSVPPFVHVANGVERFKTANPENSVPTMHWRKRVWRMGWDSNPRDALAPFGFQDRRLQPPGHPSETAHRRQCGRPERVNPESGRGGGPRGPGYIATPRGPNARSA